MVLLRNNYCRCLLLKTMQGARSAYGWNLKLVCALEPAATQNISNRIGFCCESSWTQKLVHCVLALLGNPPTYFCRTQFCAVEYPGNCLFAGLCFGRKTPNNQQLASLKLTWLEKIENCFMLSKNHASQLWLSMWLKTGWFGRVM